MSGKPFTHLNVHSDYSILIGKSKIEHLVGRAISLNMRGMALTDTGNLFGAPEFVDYVNIKNSSLPKDRRFKPIVGCELYAIKGRFNDYPNWSFENRGYRLTILAKNLEGYRNLISLVSIANTRGFFMRPRIDDYELAKHHEGLIVLSGSCGSDLAKFICNKDYEEAEKRMLWYKQTFLDNFYVVLHRYPKFEGTRDTKEAELLDEVNYHLIRLAKKHDIKLIGSTDVLFAAQEDATAQEYLTRIKLGRTPLVSCMVYPKHLWLKSQDEMCELFKDIPEAIENTEEILNKVEHYSIERKSIMSTIKQPCETAAYEMIEQLVCSNISQDTELLDKEDRLQLKLELEAIKDSRFSNFILLIRDLVIYGHKELGKLVSIRCKNFEKSLVTYVLGITDHNPALSKRVVDYAKLWNSHKFPSISIETDAECIDSLSRYILEKYGVKRVARIISFRKFGYKRALKDILKINEKSCLEAGLPNEQYENQDASIYCADNTVDFAKQIESNIRGYSVFHNSLVICSEDISNYIPVMKYQSKNSPIQLMSQYDRKSLEKIGCAIINFKVRKSR